MTRERHLSCVEPVDTDLYVGSDASRSMFVVGPRPTTQPEGRRALRIQFVEISFAPWKGCIAVKMNSEDLLCHSSPIFF